MKTHPFEPIIFNETKCLIIGSLPPESANFYFSNSTNTRLWDILTAIKEDSEIIHNKANAKSIDEKIDILRSLNLGINDIILEYDRKDYSSVSDSDIIPLKYSPIIKSIHDTHVVKLLFLYRSAAAWFLHSLVSDIPLQNPVLDTEINYGVFKEIVVNGRLVECILLPNPLNRGKAGETLIFKLSCYRNEIISIYRNLNPIDVIFNRLDDWRKLPSYQLERRFDIFFSLYLEDILAKKYKTTITAIIPEFPVRVGYLKSNHRRPNKSFKIDYLAISAKDKRVFFVELKTDNSSIRPIQMQNMLKAKELGLNKIIEGIIKVYNEAVKSYSKFKTKHLFLLQTLQNYGLVTWQNNKFVAIDNKYAISIVLIEPQNSKLIFKDCDVILFDEIIPQIMSKSDDLSTRIAASMQEWKDNPVI